MEMWARRRLEVSTLKLVLADMKNPFSEGLIAKAVEKGRLQCSGLRVRHPNRQLEARKPNSCCAEASHR